MPASRTCLHAEAWYDVAWCPPTEVLLRFKQYEKIVPFLVYRSKSRVSIYIILYGLSSTLRLSILCPSKLLFCNFIRFLRRRTGE